MARHDYTAWLEGASLFQSGEDVHTWLRSGRGGRLQTVNLQHMWLMANDASFSEVSRAATFYTADGFPVVMVARKHVSARTERVTGSDLVRDLLDGTLALPPRRWALFGSTEEGARRLREKLAEHGHELAVVDTGMVRDWDPATLAARCRAAGVQTVLVAVSQPNTEYVAQAVAESAPHLQVLGVGAGVDMAVGLVDRAPERWAALHAEWLWRFVSEPRRMFRRYFVEGIPFFLTRILPLVFGWVSPPKRSGSTASAAAPVESGGPTVRPSGPTIHTTGRSSVDQDRAGDRAGNRLRR